MLQPNQITIYSSGMGDFVRSYLVSAGKETVVSIPIRVDHIGDVLDSLKIFGKVRIVKPPSFTPENANASSLVINVQNATESLITQLSGAMARVTRLGSTGETTGRVIGLDSRDHTAANGDTITSKYLSLSVNGTFFCYDVSTIATITFTDEKVQEEVKKALDANYQRVDKNTTVMEFVLSSLDDEDHEALVHFMMPVAAPKYTYRLSMGSGHMARLEMWGVVDNTTSQDWNDNLALVTGKPISFTTDLAKIRNPLRAHLNVVDDAALGAVGIEEVVGGAYGPKGNQGNQGAVRSMGRMYSASSVSASFSNVTPAAAPESYVVDGSHDLAKAVREDAVTEEVGDFQVYQTKTPQVIPSHKSSVIPLANDDLPQCESVLIYKPGQHATRPFRAAKFQNTTDKSLGKGVCSVYMDGVNVGKGIIDEAKPNDNVVIPHQLETGVSIGLQRRPQEYRFSHIKISQGTSVTEEVQTAYTIYAINNKRDEKFRTYIEHHTMLGEGTVLKVTGAGEDTRVEKIASGFRIAITLPPRQQLTIEVVENRTTSNTIRLTSGTYHGIINNIRRLRDNPTVQAALEMERRIAAQQEKLNEIKETRTRNEAVSKRVTEYLKSGPSVAARERWESDLTDAEASIRKADQEDVPSVNAEIRRLTDELEKLLSQIVVDLDVVPDADNA